MKKHALRITDLESKEARRNKEAALAENVELVQGSGIYVRSDNLKTAHLYAGHEMTKLARALLPHVFTADELKNSVLLGKGSSKDKTGKSRPGLDQHRLETLMGIRNNVLYFRRLILPFFSLF